MNEPNAAHERLTDLVESLNNMPGIRVRDCCDGPIEDLPAGGFRVTLHVEVLDGGWTSLSALARAADRCESATIYVDGTCETCGAPLFELAGIDGQDPDALDVLICEEMSQRFERNPHNKV